MQSPAVDIEATCASYERVPGMQVVASGSGRKTPVFGQRTINLPGGARNTSGTSMPPPLGFADLCLIAATPLEEVVAGGGPMGTKECHPGREPSLTGGGWLWRHPPGR